MEVYEAVEFCKEWMPHRNYLVSNNCNFSYLSEEQKYQRLVHYCKFEEKVKAVNLNKEIEEEAYSRTIKQLVQAKVKRASTKSRMPRPLTPK